MCGIFAFLGNDNSKDILENRNYFLNLSKLIRHRGPDWSGIYIDNINKVLLSHERLSIVGVENGSQPIIDENTNCKNVLSVNGEIYNYKELYDCVLHNKYTPETKSDCEVIMHLYKEYGSQLVKMLDGIFSFVLYDEKNKKLLIARDPIGVIPLYYGYSANNELYICSEMKSLCNCTSVQEFLPGYLCELDLLYNGKLEDNTKKYYNPTYALDTYNKLHDIDEDLFRQQCRLLNRCLTRSVEKRLMADVPFGVLLSGGLDSSLIASITKRLISKRDSQWGNQLHSFSIGLKNAPDLKAAKKVADFLKTIHHEFIFTIQEGIDAIEDLIYHLETFDVTTIRASTPMFLLSRKIKSMGIKMVLSGEGADEMFGGYLYFHDAPNNIEFHNECINRVRGLHNFDCLRANKSTMAWGLEARVPFLDQSMLELVMNMDPEMKINREKKIEKHILREAFFDEEEPYLPDEILFRQKEQFSDGVGYSWIDSLIEYTNSKVTDEELTEAKKNDVNITKEAIYYLKIFDKLFPSRRNIVPRWIPRADWGCSHDPSGRAQKVHNEHNENDNF